MPPLDQSAAPIGIIGLGLLGGALAERLLEKGYPVLGYDLSAAACERLQQQGGVIAEFPQVIARESRQWLLSLPNSRIVSEVLEGLIPDLQPGTILCDTTTGDPEDAQKLAERLARSQVTYLETNVAGSSAQARTGDALLLVGGDSHAIEQSQRLLSTLAKQWFSVGPIGSASRLKLVVNLVLGLQRAVVAEGLALAERCGLDLQQTLAVLQAGPTAAQVLHTKAPRMLARDYVPVARVTQHLKDVELILKLGAEHQAQLPLSTIHRELLQRLVASGAGDLDNSAIIEAFRESPPRDGQ